MTDTNAISPVGSAHADAVRVWESDPEYAAEQARLELANRIAFMTATRRTQLGLTQKELARRIGSSHTAISRLESGIHLVSLDTLMRVCVELGITMTGHAETSAGGSSEPSAGSHAEYALIG